METTSKSSGHTVSPEPKNTDVFPHLTLTDARRCIPRHKKTLARYQQRGMRTATAFPRFWNGAPTTCIPSEKMPVLSSSIAPAASQHAEQSMGFSLSHAGWSGCRESRGSPGGADNCLPSQGEGVGGDGATAQWRQGTCLHISPGAGSLAADEVR